MKRRPVRHLLRNSLILGGILVLCAVGYGAYRWELGPANSHGQIQDFNVDPGQNAPEIAGDLARDHLIRSRMVFLTYVNLHGLRRRLEAGGYVLSSADSSIQIADLLVSGEATANRMVVPEGYELSQIEALAATHGISEASFQAALDAPHTQSFLADVPKGVSLEGYLFPDTYEVGPQTTASDLVNEMLNTFGQEVGTTYTADFAAEGLTLHQGLTLASIVEKEVSDPTDQAIVAQIFLTRYHIGMPLESDVTVAYAAQLAGVPFNTALASPYNTYVNKGLPPGPICNPGLQALDAVAHPAATDYLYFVTGKDGKTYYATTLAQHNENVAKYLN